MPRRGDSIGGGGTDFALPSSPQHMGLKAHAAEFVPGGGGEAEERKRIKEKGQQQQQQPTQTRGGVGNSAAAAAVAADMDDDAPGSDLTAHAREFVPGGVGSGSQRNAGGEDGGGDSAAGEEAGQDDAAAGSGARPGGAEKMVQVVRGGTIYFVPESEALATDQLVGPEAYGPEEEGFLWAHGSAAVAAPQRRTMHR